MRSELFLAFLSAALIVQLVPGPVIDLALAVFSGRVGDWLRRRPAFT